MRVVVFREPNRPLVVEDRDMPTLNDGDALLKIDRCGVCASDLMAIEGVVSDYSPPVALGHEIAATVVESRSPKASVGDRVTVNPMISCGACAQCRRGEDRYCAGLYGIGHDIDGGFADYMLAPAPLVERDGLIHAPADTSPDRLMFVEPLGCVLNATHDIPFAESVAVLGAGPIGLLFAQLAVKAGAETTVVEPMAERQKAARGFGAANVFEPTDDGFAALIDATDGGADTVIVATDNAAAVDQAFKAARRGGTINFFGLAPAGRMLSIELEQLHFQGYKLLASWAFTRRSLAEARDMLVADEIDLSPMVTQRFPLDRANDAIQYALDRRGIKAVLDPTLA